MPKTSGPDPISVIKQFRRLGPHPWIVMRLAAIELEKRFMSRVRPGQVSGRAGKIRQVSIRITDLCNLRCHTCGQWGDRGYLSGRDLGELKRREVTPERYMEIMTDLVDRGHRPTVYFWGGEPLLYEGLVDLVAAAAALRLPPSIATNGHNLAAVARRLVNAPLFLLQVSIDGHDARQHNLSRPPKGGGDNFQDILDGLNAVGLERRKSGRGLPLIASLTTINHRNVHHLADIYQAFRSKVDLFVYYLSWWIDDERALAHERDFQRRFGFHPKTHRGWIGGWRPEDYGVLSRQMDALRELSRPFEAPAVIFIPNITGEKDLGRYYRDHRARFGFDQCVSIFQAAEINSNGDLSPCRDYHDFVVGNIKDHTLTELWNDPGYMRFRRSIAREGLMPVCSRCCGLMGY